MFAAEKNVLLKLIEVCCRECRAKLFGLHDLAQLEMHQCERNHTTDKRDDTPGKVAVAPRGYREQSVRF
jgi:hypothetical protein